MRGDAIEHLDLRTTLDDQPFHHDEAVQLPPCREDFGQMPTRWRSGAPDAFLAVQTPPPFEETVDGRHRRERSNLPVLKGPVDGIRPVELEVAALLQLRSHGQDQILNEGFSSRGRA
jgi:hypothetical protein